MLYEKYPMMRKKGRKKERSNASLAGGREGGHIDINLESKISSLDKYFDQWLAPDVVTIMRRERGSASAYLS